MPPESDSNVDTKKEAYKNAQIFLREVQDITKYVAWIGAGLSQPTYPNWEKTIEEICDACGVPPLTEEDKSHPDPNMLPLLLLEKAEKCKVNKAQYEKTLVKIFGKMRSGSRNAYNFLMSIPFRSYITTNFDPLLMNSADPANKKVNVYPNLPWEDLYPKDGSCFYLHGCAIDKDGKPDGSGLLFAKNDFCDCYRKKTGKFLLNVFMNCPLLFIGYRLGEPEIMRFVSLVSEILEKASGNLRPPERFVLIAKERTINERKELVWDEGKASRIQEHFEGFNTRVLFYHPENPKDHVEVELFLDYVKRRPQIPKIGGKAEEVSLQ